MEGLWPDELPERPGKAAQVLVSRLRAQIGADLVVSTPTGYRLALDEAQVDSSALLLHEAASAERARAGDHAGSLAQAEAGLALWDGSTGAGAGEDLHDPVVALRADRGRTYRALIRFRALALARTGRRRRRRHHWPGWPANCRGTRRCWRSCCGVRPRPPGGPRR